MTELLQSIKSDLLSRRLLPFVALLTVALGAAIGYALLGGSSGSGSAPVASAPSTPSGGVTALPVSVAPANPNEAVSETPGGVRYQSQGPTRDPFTPLPSPPAAKSASTSSSSAKSSAGSSGKSSGSSSGGSSPGGSGPSSGGRGASEPKAPAPAPKKPAKPQLAYDVSVLFGAASPTPGQPATLTPYESLKLGQPFPSKQDVRISFERVTANGSGAVFKLVVPPILHGSGSCLPSNSECQTIDLQAGQSEELQYVEADGQVAVYELKVVSIAKRGASAARVKHSAKAAHVALRVKAAHAIGDASSLQRLSSAHAPAAAHGWARR
ncbi:MAG TPA: hypothetical protein VNX67_05860 [Solirubrobacteraceae bacterium]|jgi:hypothetical protein|nr:hypothetical protein [Solirubrobacteraceae bacterium]